MAVSSIGIISLLIAIMSGGATDMLDFVSSDAYWKAKGVTVSVEQLLGELKTADAADLSAQIRALGAGTYAEREAASKTIIAQGRAALPQLEKFTDDPDIEVSNRVKGLIRQIQVASKAMSVRRLVAIRNLGEMKKPEALPALKGLLNSNEMFVADYAARAVAQIEGKPLLARGSTPDHLKTDVSLLPADCGVIGQVSFVNRKPVALEEFVKNLPKNGTGEDPAKMIGVLNSFLISTLDSIGNVRVESVTFAVADTIGDKDGYVTLLMRGKYDREALGTFLRNIFPQMGAVEGADVLSPDEHLAVALASDDYIIASAGAAQDKLPTKPLLAAIRSGKGAVMTNPQMAKLLASADTTGRVWAVASVSPSYRGAEILKAFDTLVLTTKEEKDALSLKIAGAGANPADVNAAVDKLNQHLDTARQQLPQVAQQMPFLKPLQDLLQSMKCEATGTNATLTGAYQGDPAALLAIPFAAFGVRAAHEPVPPPQPVQQVQPQPNQ